MKLYVEGGGDSNALRTACREGFTSFITKAGLVKRPRVVGTFFGPGFDASALPAIANSIESRAKADVYDALERSTRASKTKAAYAKGPHSFKLLAAIDPAKVTAASPWAKRFIECLKAKMQ